MFSSTWFALDKSRGFEDHLLKVFMRATVIGSEYLTYIPAVVIFQRNWGRMNALSPTASVVALVAILMQPATLLIDHGHFQYNTVMLGLVVSSVSCLLTNHVLWGSAFFVAALGFKQMALYYSPLVFAYLLGSCLTPQIQLLRLISIGIVTLVSFGCLFAPLLLGSLYDTYRGILPLDTRFARPPLLASITNTFKIKLPPDSSFLTTVLLQLTQAIHRIFPFARGLFEDKVANFWCLLNHTVIKLSSLPATITLPRLSLYATLASILPSCFMICAVPRKSILLYAFASCSWGFFLFSFQVHEKSVLLPLLPMTLLLGSLTGLGREIRSWVGWANILGTFTLYPLLKRDELRTPYVVILLLWAYLLGLPPTSMSLYLPLSSSLVSTSLTSSDQSPTSPATIDSSSSHVSLLTTLIHLSSYLAMLLWHVLEATVPPPKHKPDLYVVLNVVIGALGFGICYIWCTWKTIEGSGIVEVYWDYVRSEDERKRKEKEKQRAEKKKIDSVGHTQAQGGKDSNRSNKKTRSTPDPQHQSQSPSQPQMPQKQKASGSGGRIGGDGKKK